MLAGCHHLTKASLDVPINLLNLLIGARVHSVDKALVNVVELQISFVRFEY